LLREFDWGATTPGIKIRGKEVRTLAEGVIKWFSEKKGYGFIEQENGQDVFFHYSYINMPGFKTVNGGDRVNFDLEEGNRGPVAKNIIRL
jgi:CspA family cold shock protein